MATAPKTTELTATATSSSSNTVTVGCKLPNGLVLEFGGKSVEVNGANSSVIIGGYGLTEGVDAAFFDAWMEAHEAMPFVRNQLIFAQSKTADAQAEATEKAGKKTGFEGMGADTMPAGVTVSTDK